jgi:hypothetical protein
MLRPTAAAVAMIATLQGTPSLAVISNVGQASDICAVDADPCVIDQQVKILDGAILDFGPRRIRIDLGGYLDSGAGSVTLLCGGLEAAVGVSVAINARGPNGQGATGVARVYGRRFADVHGRERLPDGSVRGRFLQWRCRASLWR